MRALVEPATCSLRSTLSRTDIASTPPMKGPKEVKGSARQCSVSLSLQGLAAGESGASLCADGPSL